MHNKKIRFSTMLTIILFLVATTLSSATKQERITQHIAKANYYLNKNDISSSIIEYQKALKIAPTLIKINYKLGQIYFKQRMYNFAIQEYKKVVNTKKQTENLALILDAHMALAQTYFRLGKKIDIKSGVFINLVQMEKALRAIIKKCTAYKPSRKLPYTINKKYYLGKTYFILARIYRDRNHEILYPKYFQKALDYDYKKAECHYFLWEYYHYKKNSKKAKKHKKKALRLDKQIFNKKLSKPLINYFKKR